MAPIKHLPLLVLLCVAALPAAHAEEGGEKEADPKAAYAARAAALPAPSAKHAFETDCDLVSSGQTLGRATFSAQPLQDDPGVETFGDAEVVEYWVVRETMVFGGGAVRRKLETFLDAHLEPVRGSVEGVDPDRTTFRVAWHRTSYGFLLNHTTGEGEAQTSREEKLVHEGPFLSSISALWLFCRMNLGQPGRFDVTLFDAAPSPKESNFERGNWAIGEPSTWDEAKAVVVKGKKGDTTGMEAGFEATTGAFLGARFQGSMPAPLEFRVRSGDEPEKPEALPYTPAKTAKDAAKQGALALAVGDLGLVEESLHWPTLHAAAKARYQQQVEAGAENPEPVPASVEEFRTNVLSDVAKSLQKRPAAMIQMAMKMAESGLKEEEHEGFTRVKFPPVFGNLEIDVAEFDGTWFMIRFPSKPK